MKLFSKTLLVVVFLFPPLFASAYSTGDLNGMILLQVEASGEAWYVYPKTADRYFLGRPADAFQIMRNLGLGVKHEVLEQYLSGEFPEKLSGMIVLDVETDGEAYYIYPRDRKGYYLGRPADAFRVMREKGLGISNFNLSSVQISVSTVVPELTREYKNIETRAFDLINYHRERVGAQKMEWSDIIAEEARKHSFNMATGRSEEGHDGFDRRIEIIRGVITNYNEGAENIAWNYSSDPAKQALDWWLTSEGHKTSLENDIYDLTGIGVYRASDGRYYVTQIFVSIY